MRKKYDKPYFRIRHMIPIILTEVSNIYVGRDYGKLDSKGFGTFLDDDEEDEYYNLLI